MPQPSLRGRLSQAAGEMTKIKTFILGKPFATFESWWLAYLGRKSLSRQVGWSHVASWKGKRYG
jgi:hypothetical protein